MQADLTKIFFGRTETLELLKKRVINLKEGYRQNVALLGSQYVGKSTILYQFLLSLDEDDVTVIYLDLENKDFHYFFTKFAGSLLYNFCKSKNLPLHDDLNLLIETTQQHIPHTVQVIKKVQRDFARGKFSDSYLGLLMVPEIFTNETGMFCVLILDEFQNLEEFMIPDVFVNLGRKIMTQKRCFYILSSSYQGLAKGILSEKLSLLFGNFETVMIEPFDLKTSQEFIDKNLSGIRIGAQMRNFLTDFAGGHPLYLNLICQELRNLCAIHKQVEIYIPLLSQAIENTIFDRWGALSRHFELMISDLCKGKDARLMSSLLMAMANGNHKMDDLVMVLGIKKTQITQRLNTLIELNIVVKNGNFYYYKDKLFRYWIKYVYQKRLKDVELTHQKQRKQFKEEFQACVERFNQSSREDFPSRIVELLHCFDNEAFDLNGRKYKLPLFRDIKPVKLRNENGTSVDVIRATTEDAIWFIGTKKDNFVEHDVNTILAESKKGGRRSRRCLIVSLTDLDENTRLRALQERFWIWNESELNTLLTLFDKPYIL